MERKCFTCNSDQHLEKNCPGRRKWFRVFNKTDADYDQWIRKKKGATGRVAALQEEEGEAEEEREDQEEEEDLPEWVEEDEGQEEMTETDPDFL